MELWKLGVGPEGGFSNSCAWGRMSSASDKHIPAGASRLAAFAAESSCVDTIVGEV